MSRLVAYLANDASRLACALYSSRSALVAPIEGLAPPVDSWGFGFYQDEILLQRRPKPPSAPVDFYDAVHALRTDAFIGHVRAGTVGKPKNENTHPFRFRSWLFAHHGTLPAFEAHRAAVLELVPDFLRRNIRGETDSEVLFYVVLTELMKTNRLDDSTLSTSIVSDAVRTALQKVDDILGSAAAEMECALALTNGRILCATRRRCPVSLCQIGPIHDCPVCRESALSSQKADARKIDHEHLRAVLLVAAAATPLAGPGWRDLAEGTLLCVDDALQISEASV